jgi:DtxR family transcriptional regulator, manganese transport regulator
LTTGRPYREIFLTDEGHKLAARIRARVTVDVLLLTIDAEGIERYVFKATLKAFVEFLRLPTRT